MPWPLEVFADWTTDSCPPCSAAISRMSSVIRIEQYFGPHMLQKWADLERVLRQRFVVHAPGRFGIERQAELLVPVEGEAGPAEGVVAVAGALAAAGEVGGVGGDLVGDHALLHVFAFGRPRCSLGVT